MSPTILPVPATLSLSGSLGSQGPSPASKPEGAGKLDNSAPVVASPGPVATPTAGTAPLPADPTDVVEIGLFAGANEFYAEVFDRRTHEMRGLIPPEAILKLHARLHQDVGIKLDQKV